MNCNRKNSSHESDHTQAHGFHNPKNREVGYTVSSHSLVHRISFMAISVLCKTEGRQMELSSWRQRTFPHWLNSMPQADTSALSQGMPIFFYPQLQIDRGKRLDCQTEAGVHFMCPFQKPSHYPHILPKPHPEWKGHAMSWQPLCKVLYKRIQRR